MKSYNLYNELYLSNKINNPFHVIFFLKKKKKKKKKRKLIWKNFNNLEQVNQVKKTLNILIDNLMIPI